ncbi:hypothetical protein Rhopal_002538-T1 [Rhodotorula paludigena]|uniref:Proteophosphoglycan ppg4 n=1 Tax=Rhodotorula paludigena TaxID=86838 RepID=A0AAV5GAC0_9BASI|nr:hypothetical protein Rhopal_002538-T1 [Rhodotorula paludigena]
MDAALSSPLYDSLSFAHLSQLFGFAPPRAPSLSPERPLKPAAPPSSTRSSLDNRSGGLGASPSPALGSARTKPARKGMATARNAAAHPHSHAPKSKAKAAGARSPVPIAAVMSPHGAATGADEGSAPPAASTSSSLALPAPAVHPGRGSHSLKQGMLADEEVHVAPFAPRSAPRPLPRVELEAFRTDSPSYSSSFASNHTGYHSVPSVPSHPADRDEYADKRASSSPDSDQLSSSSGYSDSFAYTDDEFASDELEDDDEGDETYDSAVEHDAELDADEESDERRPFPNPQLSKQQKYLRRLDDDKTFDVDVEVQPVAAAPNKPPVSPTNAATAYHPSYTSPTSAFPSASHATVHYAPVSGATYDDALALAAAQGDAAEPFDPLDGPYPRGRSRHPRLLWRSELDTDALRVLDAHHERLRGGPLPRLDLDLCGGKVLSASGVEREREHAGVELEELKEKVRRARRRADREGRRTWSQAGRKWSREMERVGL